MILNVDDFNCAPDGRFLERASIETGSTVLTDLDGVLRPSDVGKNIAIPGAQDLTAKIARLIDRREVRNAKMEAGSNVLTGILFDPTESAGQDEEPFLQTSHKDRRITVAGAGTNGETLVTHILKVRSANEVELAIPAANTVSGVEVILNKGDRVALEGYARRSVNNVTVDLEDRSISDAEMLVGGPLLLSASAGFSSVDLGKTVTIREAGLLVTTIQAVNSSTEATLAAPAQRDVLDGQADIWKTDSRSAWENLVASLASLDVPSAEIQFGPGVYDFGRKSAQTHPVDATIGLQNLKNLTMRGAGPGVTILRLMPQQDLSKGVTHFLEIRDCKNLTFRDFSVHGSYLTLIKTNEQVHGITLNEGSENILVERVRVFQSAGDGIRFLGRRANPTTGKPENKVRNVRVEGCDLIQNKRTGLAFQRAVELVWVRDCYIEMTPPSTDSCIDLEPSGLSPTDLIFDANIMKHGTLAPAVSLSGSAGPDPARRIKFSNNQITGGHIFCTDVNELTIQNNTIRVANFGTAQRIPIHVALGGDSLIITGNLVANDHPFTKAVISLEGKREVRRALVTNNLCFAGAGNGIQCLSSDDVIVEGNMIVATGLCNNGILVRSESSAVENISARKNDITVQDAGKWENGVHVVADPNPIRHISVIGNSIRGAGKGVVFEGTQYGQLSQLLQRPLCALNRTAEDVTLPFVGLRQPSLESIVVGGATGRGGGAERSGAGRWIAGLGDPNHKVPGNVGDIFQSLDGAPGKTFWVKEMGNGTNTGWTAK
jgi:hypothetical protein